MHKYREVQVMGNNNKPVEKKEAGIGSFAMYNAELALKGLGMNMGDSFLDLGYGWIIQLEPLKS